jgi:hypothetical protein
VGLLTNKNDETNSDKALENMLDQFDIDLEGYELDENNKDKNDEINKKRKEKKIKEKDSF